MVLNYILVGCPWQTLYFLFKVRRARVIKDKPQGIYWPPASRGRVGKEENRRSALALARSLRSRARLALAHADVLQKNEKKNETFVYRLNISLEEYLQGKTLVFETVQRNRPKVCRTSTRRWSCLELRKIWMNNKTIFEFGFRRMWRIMQAEMDNILMDLHNSSHPTQPHSIIVKCFSSPILHKQCFQFSRVLQSSQEKSGSKLMHNFRGKTRLVLQVLQTPQRQKIWDSEPRAGKSSEKCRVKSHEMSQIS